MRMLHLADLHFGKRLYGYDLIEDFQYAIENIKQVIVACHIDVVLMAGDIYDRAVPGLEAVRCLNDFLTSLIDELHVRVILVAGNHDSASRLDFLSGLLARNGLYIIARLEETMKPVVLEDELGPVAFYGLPYVSRLELADLVASDNPRADRNELLKEYMERQNFVGGRKVLVGHLTCLENPFVDEVGGMEWVSPDLFAAFDYTALGHLHAFHQVGSGPVYYSGALLPVSVDEGENDHAFTIVDLKEEVTVTRHSWQKLHEVKKITGYYADLLKNPSEDYVFLNLLDTRVIINAADQARQVFPRFLGLSYEHIEQMMAPAHPSEVVKKHATADLFAMFFEQCTGQRIDADSAMIFADYYQGDEHED